jgi:octaprenyl-diphosphate synthase
MMVTGQSPAFAMNLEKINELTAQDMAGVNATILEQLNSDVQLINQLGYYIVSGGGKRIRPMIAVWLRVPLAIRKCHVTIAALIEFIHTATLLHDDVWMNQICVVAKPRQCGVWQRSQRAGR